MLPKNLTTIGETYFLKELRDGFDTIERDELKIQMSKRTGNEYTNFSNKCVVMYAPKKGKYKQGDVVWVHHYVVDQKQGDYMYAREDQIWFKGDSLLNVNNEKIVVFKYKLHEETTTASGLILISYDTDGMEKYGFKGEVVSGGGLKKGDTFYFIKNTEYELWENEEQYFIVDIDNVCKVNGRIRDGYYETKKVNITDMYFNHKLRMVKGGVISLLNNPNLPNDGLFCVLRKKPSCSFVRPEEVLALLDVPVNVATVF